MPDPRRLRDALRRFGDAAHELAAAFGEEAPLTEAPKKRTRKVVVAPPVEPVTDAERARARSILRRGV